MARPGSQSVSAVQNTLLKPLAINVLVIVFVLLGMSYRSIKELLACCPCVFNVFFYFVCVCVRRPKDAIRAVKKRLNGNRNYREVMLALTVS